MAGKNKKQDGEQHSESAIPYGQTGYPIIYQEEGKDELTGNFITDEDLAEYQEFKKKKETGQFITNDEAAHYQSLKDEANAATGKLEAEQAAAVKKEQDEKESARQAAINQYGPNPVHAVRTDGSSTTWTRQAWDNLPWETKDGKETTVKTGGWSEKTETPEELQQFRDAKSNA